MLILFIDDDKEDFELFRDALALVSAEAEAMHAWNGKDALNLLRTIPASPDFIFLDANMPGLSGEETPCGAEAKPHNVEGTGYYLQRSRRPKAPRPAEQAGRP